MAGGCLRRRRRWNIIATIIDAWLMGSWLVVSSTMLVLWVMTLLLSSRRYGVKEKNERVGSVGSVGIVMDRRRLVLTLLEDLSQADATA